MQRATCLFSVINSSSSFDGEKRGKQKSVDDTGSSISIFTATAMFAIASSLLSAGLE